MKGNKSNFRKTTTSSSQWSRIPAFCAAILGHSFTITPLDMAKHLCNCELDADKILYAWQAMYELWVLGPDHARKVSDGKPWLYHHCNDPFQPCLKKVDADGNFCKSDKGWQMWEVQRTPVLWEKSWGCGPEPDIELGPGDWGSRAQDWVDAFCILAITHVRKTDSDIMTDTPFHDTSQYNMLVQKGMAPTASTPSRLMHLRPPFASAEVWHSLLRPFEHFKNSHDMGGRRTTADFTDVYATQLNATLTRYAEADDKKMSTSLLNEAMRIMYSKEEIIEHYYKVDTDVIRHTHSTVQQADNTRRQLLAMGWDEVAVLGFMGAHRHMLALLVIGIFPNCEAATPSLSRGPRYNPRKRPLTFYR